MQFRFTLPSFSRHILTGATSPWNPWDASLPTLENLGTKCTSSPQTFQPWLRQWRNTVKRAAETVGKGKGELDLDIVQGLPSS